MEPMLWRDDVRSITVTLWPLRVRAIPALKPAIPAPMITTSYDGELAVPILMFREDRKV